MENQITETQEPVQIQQTLFDLESLTVKNTKSISGLQEEIKKLQEMIKDTYENDPTYHTLKTEAKKFIDNVSAVKLELDKREQQKLLKDKLKTLQEELREKKHSVSDYALEYSRLANSSTIEIEGKVYDIVRTAKLVKRSK